MGSALPAAVRAFLAEHALPPGPGMIAVSGGADSVALLRALAAAGAGPLHVAHFHHHLRGAEADADAAFVRELAAEQACEFHLGEADVSAAGGNVEAAARRLRYQWLGAVARAVGAAWVATGHTANDQAETVLHRLVRGTGLRGLRGIRAWLPNPPGPPSLGGKGGDAPTDLQKRPPASAVSQDVTQHKHPSPLRGGAGGEVDHANPPARHAIPLVRPLLAVARADVLGFLAELGQPFRTDSSNADPRFTRNRVRADVLPLLATFNPDVVAALNRAAGQASDAFDLIDRLAADLLARAELPRAGDLVILDAAALAAAEPLLAREALRKLWEREGWPTNQFRAAHWHRVLAVARGDPPAADFAGGVGARRVGRVVRLGRRS